MFDSFDVILIGAGVIGCAIASELSKYKVSVCVIEKESDVAQGTSSRNSGVIHSGINYKPGSNRAIFCVKGNKSMSGLCMEMGVKLSYIGKLTVAMDDSEIKILEILKEQGESNGVPGMEMLGTEVMRKIQPDVEGICALFTPSSGIINPYGLTISLAENACENGVSFFLNHELVSVEKRDTRFRVRTKGGRIFESLVAINSAGLNSDTVSSMFGADGYKIYPCRGEYFLLDKNISGMVKTLVYPAPKKSSSGLGIHLTPTVDGNVLVGPSSDYVGEKEDYSCTRDVMKMLLREGQSLLPSLDIKDFIIRNFSGIRPKRTSPAIGGYDDFVIEDHKNIKGFINLVGIESPGLTSSPAIAEHVTGLVAKHISLEKKENFKPGKGRVPSFNESNIEDKIKMAEKSRGYGEIICRCELVTKDEILGALDNPLGVQTIAGIKFRTRATMGRCQGGFCTPRIVRLLREEAGWGPEDFLLKGKASPVLCGFKGEKWR